MWCEGYGFGLERVVVVVRHYLYVATESDYLVADFLFEAYDYGNGYEHYGKSERDAYYGYTYSRARHLLVVTLFAIEAVCYE